ncbi:MAG: IclR family transcriptional regulator, partial [Actinomycetota bacterium]|nr:IclR family transcriptional regulator [Actinomycetota bacterium]
AVGSPRPHLSTAAHGPLAALARATGETTHLVVLEGNSVRFVDGVDGEQTLRVGSRVGVLLPAHATSGGKALLAELAPEELHGLYAAGLPATRPGAPGDLAALRRELGRVRRRGFALNLEESERGVNAVGACVRSVTGAPVAAAVVAGPAVRCGRRELLALADPLLETARTIRTALHPPVV